MCIYIAYIYTNFRILLFRCSSCSINRGVLYVYTTLDDKNYINQQLKQLVSYLSLASNDFFNNLRGNQLPAALKESHVSVNKYINPIIFLHFPLEKFGNLKTYSYLCSRFWRKEQGTKNKDQLLKGK